MYGLYLQIMQGAIMEFIAQLVKRILNLVLQIGEVGPSILWGRDRHDELDYQLNLM
jgi:hypothetical protein